MLLDKEPRRRSARQTAFCFDTSLYTRARYFIIFPFKLESNKTEREARTNQRPPGTSHWGT